MRKTSHLCIAALLFVLSLLSPPARAEPDNLVAYVEVDLALQNINYLLVRVIVRTRLVPRVEPVERECRTLTRKGLARDAFADMLPRQLIPIDVL